MRAPRIRLALVVLLAVGTAAGARAQVPGPLDRGDWAGVLARVTAAADSALLMRRAPVLIGTGRASYYGERFRGRRTASGERFDPNALTAAHRTLPFGTRLLVTHLANGRSVVVRVTDRGPFHGRRILDLSKEAARRLGMIRQGVGRVRIERLPRATPRP